MPVDIVQAREALHAVVHEWWATHASPILGSQLKASLLKHLPEFNEKELGYKNFASFVRDDDAIALHFRGTTDFGAVPIQQAKVFDEAPQASEIRIRIRNDFWQAFVGFAVPDQARAYDRPSDKIIRCAAQDLPADALVIQPIERETQLEWRRSFIQSLGPDSPLSETLPKLKADGGFKVFSEALEPHAELRRRWHSLFANHVAGVIRAWAMPHEISDDVWLTREIASPITSDVVRKRIYELLDIVPVEELLEIRLPIRLLLNLPSTGSNPSEE